MFKEFNENIKSAELKFTGAELNVSKNEGDKIKIELLNPDERKLEDLDISTENDQLIIEEKKKMSFKTYTPYILNVFIPEKIEKLLLSTISGEIDIKEIAPKEFSVKTVSGEINAEGGSFKDDAEINVKTTSGDVKLNKIKGKFYCKTVSGDFQIIDSEIQTLKMKSVSGDVIIKGKYSGNENFISTVSGDVVLKIKTDEPHTFYYKTISGDLSKKGVAQEEEKEYKIDVDLDKFPDLKDFEELKDIKIDINIEDLEKEIEESVKAAAEGLEGLDEKIEESLSDAAESLNEVTVHLTGFDNINEKIEEAKEKIMNVKEKLASKKDEFGKITKLKIKLDDELEEVIELKNLDDECCSEHDHIHAVNHVHDHIHAVHNAHAHHAHAHHHGNSTIVKSVSGDLSVTAVEGSAPVNAVQRTKKLRIFKHGKKGFVPDLSFLKDIFVSVKKSVPRGAKPAQPARPAQPAKPAKPAKPAYKETMDSILSALEKGDITADEAQKRISKL